MCKYHKIIKLSTLLEIQRIFSRLTGYLKREKISRFLTVSIAFVSLASLIFNFLFPHIALAVNIDKSNALSFNYLEAVKISPYISEIAVAGKIEQEPAKISMSPVEPALENNGVKGIIINLTLAKKVLEEEVVSAVNETNDDVAEKICLIAGIIDQPCWQDLKAIRIKESYDGKVMVGDGGKSRGWYHIQIKMHRISNECALDFECSTEWTVKNLIANGYKTNRFYAISRHNGGGAMAKAYARSVVYNSAKLER